ncbi:hypothetical protein [Fructobacillus tropaeoli]|uniref:IS30 family (Tra8) n=1 Tax=Fructobacillus tropaeoli TaxID=709323 RepID=A0ABM9N205_9LACO|nr:IS30 family (Tra8) [Fructobacillus tropaeoli]
MVVARQAMKRNSLIYSILTSYDYGAIESLAQQDANHKRKKCGRKPTLSRSQKSLIEEYLTLTWSPEIVTHQLK